MNKEIQIFINEAAKTYQKNGILDQHFAGFSKTAQSENVIIIVRHVNPITKKLISQNYPPKGLNIKAKSADWGVHAGFIISREELFFLNKKGLKVDETQATKIQQLYQLFIAHSDWNWKDQHFVTAEHLQLESNEMILTISTKHLQYLLSEQQKNDFKIQDHLLLANDNLLVKAQIPGQNHESAHFYLQKENNNYLVYYAFALDETGQVKNLNAKTLSEIAATEAQNLIFFPLVVYCELVNGMQQPLVPDYDLLAVFWQLDWAIKYHQPPIPTNCFSSKRRRTVSDSVVIEIKQKMAKKNVDEYRRHSFSIDDEKFLQSKYGNTSRDSVTFFNNLNKNLGYQKGINDVLAPVRHGFELTNPLSENFNDNLYTFFLPNSNLLVDFNYSGNEKLTNQQEPIWYFIIDCGEDAVGDSSIFKALLKHFHQKGYYINNNCSIEATKDFGITTKVAKFWYDLEKSNCQTKKIMPPEKHYNLSSSVPTSNHYFPQNLNKWNQETELVSVETALEYEQSDTFLLEKEKNATTQTKVSEFDLDFDWNYFY